MPPQDKGRVTVVMDKTEYNDERKLTKWIFDTTTEWGVVFRSHLQTTQTEHTYAAHSFS